MTSKERWINTVERKRVDRIPLDLWATPEVLVSLQKYLGAAKEREVYDLLHVDRPLIISPKYNGPPLPDGTDIWGCKTKTVRYASGSYEETVYSPLAEYSSVDEIDDGYTWPTADLFGYSMLNMEMDGSEELPVQYGMAGVYTDYMNMRGLEQGFIDFALNQDIVSHCMGKMYDLAYERATRVFEAVDNRIDFAWMHHDMGSQIDLLVSPDTAKRLLIPGMKRMAALAHEAGAKMCLHSDGAIRKAIPMIIESGIEVLNPVQWRCTGMAREGLKADFGNDLTFHGAMDNQITLVSGNPELVRKEVQENIDIFAQDGGYIFAPCHNLQPVTSPEIIVGMYEEAYNYGR